MKTGSYVIVKHGVEGPRYDPYSYTEVTMHRDGRYATIHSGLGTWMTYNDGRVVRKFDDPFKILRSKFEAVMGITPERARRIPDTIKNRRYKYHPCGIKHMHGAEGYPGESLVVCGKCGDVIDSSFDISAIE
jgi:hypothetical protein